MADPIEENVLRALRRITRAIDLHSRQLATTFGLTAPQLVCLRTIGNAGQITPSALAREVSLSQATITGIIDRLVARQLVERVRSETDRRQVTVTLAPAGQALIRTAPSPLQERFAQRLRVLPTEQRQAIQATLDSIVDMMDGAGIDAAPLLTASPSSEALEEGGELEEDGYEDASS